MSQSMQLGRSMQQRQQQQLEVIRPLVLILGEETRTLKAKYSALRGIAEKGLNSYGASLQQVRECEQFLISAVSNMLRQVYQYAL